LNMARQNEAYKNHQQAECHEGTTSNWNCDTTSTQFVPTEEYYLDRSGHIEHVKDGTLHAIRENVFANGTLFTTNDGIGVRFILRDWLGSTRVQTTFDGFSETNCINLPFGESQPCGTVDNHLFTGKERDVESGLDYFGARYYSSNMGRFSSPDPSGLAYADQSNPQSLNLYSYALNNPLKNTDPTGLYCYYGSTAEDSGDASQYDFHSSQGECTAADENGNRGEWVPDPTTTVNVNAETGDTDTLSVFTGNTGNVQNQTTQSSHTTGCPAVPTAPSGVSVNENMQIAKLSYLFQPPPFNQLWFRNMVNYGGVWDYKTQGAQYENFGNFNYGATGTAAGAPPFTLRRAAGRAQRGHAGSPQFGGDPGSLPSIFLNPGGGTAPYGDDPNDQKFINLGIKYAQMGCTG
jgi:RHS repeat-associated protein